MTRDYLKKNKLIPVKEKGGLAGLWRKHPNLVYFGVSIGIVMLIGFIIKLSSGRQSYAVWDGKNEEPNADFIVMESSKGRTTGNGVGYIEGTAYSTRKDLSYVQLTFGIINDLNDHKTGTCIADATNLRAKTKWEFKAICSGVPSGGWSFVIDDVTSW